MKMDFSTWVGMNPETAKIIMDKQPTVLNLRTTEMIIDIAKSELVEYAKGNDLVQMHVSPETLYICAFQDMAVLGGLDPSTGTFLYLGKIEYDLSSFSSSLIDGKMVKNPHMRITP